MLDEQTWLLLLLGTLGVLGALIGSFLNVVVWRVPRGQSVVSPPSACPRCGHAIRARDNVPILSWMILRGRCRDCGTAISARYPALEISCAVLFVLVGIRFGFGWSLPAFLFLAAIGLALTLIDMDVKRLPDSIVLPAYPVSVLLLALASWGTSDWGAMARALVGAATLWTVYFVLAIAMPGGMGFGDVKLAGVLGAHLAWLGWGPLVVGGFAAFLLGGLFSVVLLLGGRATRKSGIPFGPWMIAGAAFGIAVGAPIWRGYLDVSGF